MLNPKKRQVLSGRHEQKIHAPFIETKTVVERIFHSSN